MKGDKGDKGDIGEQGIQGPAGPQGLKGDKGDIYGICKINIFNTDSLSQKILHRGETFSTNLYANNAEIINARSENYICCMSVNDVVPTNITPNSADIFIDRNIIARNLLGDQSTVDQDTLHRMEIDCEIDHDTHIRNQQGVSNNVKCNDAFIDYETLTCASNIQMIGGVSNQSRDQELIDMDVDISNSVRSYNFIPVPKNNTYCKVKYFGSDLKIHYDIIETPESKTLPFSPEARKFHMYGTGKCCITDGSRKVCRDFSTGIGHAELKSNGNSNVTIWSQ